MKALAPVLLVLSLVGCSAVPAAAPTPAPVPTMEPVGIVETCADLSNMLTLLDNASASNHDGRLTNQELHGAVLLSESLLDDVDVEPGTGLADEVSILQNLGAEFGVLNYDHDPRIEFSDWNASMNNVADLCEAGGVQFGIMGWTGG